MRFSFACAVLLVSGAAHADEAIARHFVGASFGGFASAGFEGSNVTGLRFSAFSGFRLSRWVSIEGLFDATLQPSPIPEFHAGPICGGQLTDLFHWETFGARLWVHVEHSAELDFSIAPPSIALGPGFDRQRGTLLPNNICAPKPQDIAGLVISVGLVSFAFELRGETRWFAVRVWTNAELDIAPDLRLGVISVSGSAGPVFRF